MPPTASQLVSFSLIFSSAGTFSNYLGAVRTQCLRLAVSTDAFSDPVLAKARAAVKKRQVKDEGTPIITIAVLPLLIRISATESDRTSCALYVLAYWFLGRVPSECLALRLGASETKAPRDRKLLVVGNSSVRILYNRRKNQDYRSAETRTCKCHIERFLCPVHVLIAYTRRLQHGDLVFPNLTPSAVNAVLRRRAAEIGIDHPHKVTSKAFRRGHSHDLVQADSPPAQVLGMGGWRPGGGLFNYVPKDVVRDCAVNRPPPAPACSAPAAVLAAPSAPSPSSASSSSSSSSSS